MCLFNKSVLVFHIDFVVIEFQHHVVTDLPELESRLKSMDELSIVYGSKTFSTRQHSCGYTFINSLSVF